jgi:hypothetical protein
MPAEILAGMADGRAVLLGCMDDAAVAIEGDDRVVRIVSGVKVGHARSM